jgi:microtubule-associated protein-like 6
MDPDMEQLSKPSPHMWIEDDDVHWSKSAHRETGADDDEVMTQEGDPLSDAESEPAEPPLMIEADVDGDDEERDFMAIKPWLGTLFPPSKYRKNRKDLKSKKTVFTEDNNNWSRPEAKIELDYIFGYRARNCRNNAHWVNKKDENDQRKIVFHAGAVGVVYKLDEDDQDFFTGHDDDIVCLDYHEGSRLAASGSIGAGKTVRLCIWEIDGNLKQRQCITGFQQYAVIAVAFNPSASMVASVGMDEHHSVALNCVETGMLLAHLACDKNRILSTMFNTSAAVDSDASFITVGVKHICFWGPMDATAVKGKNYYMSSPDPLDRRLDWQRGTECDVIDDVTFNTAVCTPLYVMCGGNDGSVYAFDCERKNLVFKFRIGKTPVQALCEVIPGGSSIAAGCKDGWVRFYDITEEKATPSTAIKTSDGYPEINVNLCDEATDNASDVLVNSIRSLSYNFETKEVLAGTIISHLYSISLPKSTNKKINSKALVSGHWGQLSSPDGYGEIWGVDCHPTKQLILSCSMDGTVREWCIDRNKETKRLHVKYACSVLNMSLDESMLAVGHFNGSFTVVDGSLTTIVWPNTRDRKRRVQAIKFSPSCKFLAVASEMSIDIYSIKEGDPMLTRHGSSFAGSLVGKKVQLKSGPGGKVFTRIGWCRGHTSLVRHFDWNLASTLIQSTSTGYELLYFSVPDCARTTGARHLADQHWFTQSCELGWSVQGIWPRFSDGTDINTAQKSQSERLIATTDDFGKVNVYNYPCVGSGMDHFGHVEQKPVGIKLKGHSSHVTNCAWSPQDQYLVSTGGADLCIFIWKVTYATPPKKFVDAKTVLGMQKAIDDAMSKKAAKEKMEAEGIDVTHMSTSADLAASPLMSGVGGPVDDDDDDDGGAALRERLTKKQREWIAPPNCEMCDFVFKDAEQMTCPRCMMPRKMLRGNEATNQTHLTKAPKPMMKDKTKKFQFSKTGGDEEPECSFGGAERFEKKKSNTMGPQGVKSRLHLPTTAFARQTQEIAKQRQAHEDVRKVPNWQPGSSNARVPAMVDDDSDSDDAAIRKHVRVLKAGETARRKPLVAPDKKKKPTSKKAPKTAGPDFCDF